jgi:hypothetical protein
MKKYHIHELKCKCYESDNIRKLTNEEVLLKWLCYCDNITINKGTCISMKCTSNLLLCSSCTSLSLRIWVRIDPSHTLVCHKRQLNGDPWGSGLE